MKKLVLVKLGGSLITDKTRPFTEKTGVIKRLCREIHQARRAKKDIRVVVGHGGGSYPHVPAQQYQTTKGVVNKQSLRGIAEVQDAASRLNRIVVRALIDNGETAISIAPSSCCLAKNGQIKKWFLDSIEKSLELNLLPVVFGDVVLDARKGCCILSTEMILAYLAEKLDGKKIILCGTTDGVWDNQGEIIAKITVNNFGRFKRHLGQSDGIDVTGVMIHKVEEMLKLTQKGPPSLIINGNKPNLLKKAILDQRVPGTLISDGK